MTDEFELKQDLDDAPHYVRTAYREITIGTDGPMTLADRRKILSALVVMYDAIAADLY